MLPIPETAGIPGSAAPERRCNFKLHLCFEIAFLPLKLKRSCHVNMNIFSLKTGNLIIRWLPLSYIHTMPARLQILTKYESKGTLVASQSP